VGDLEEVQSDCATFPAYKDFPQDESESVASSKAGTADTVNTKVPSRHCCYSYIFRQCGSVRVQACRRAGVPHNLPVQKFCATPAWRRAPLPQLEVFKDTRHITVSLQVGRVCLCKTRLLATDVVVI